MVAAAVIGSAVVGAAVSSSASRSAANTQADAARDAENKSDATQRYMYDTTRADYAPYRQAGYNALNSINALLKNPQSITSDPGYQFGMNEGLKSINSQAAAHGNYYSGATLKALNRYSQDYAGSQLDNAFNRYARVANIGTVATNGTEQAGQNYANQISAGTQNMLGAANARGAASIAQGNAWQNAVNGIGYGAMNYFNRPGIQPVSGEYSAMSMPDYLGTNGGFGYKNGTGGF
jgi:hypothetical protein